MNHVSEISKAVAAHTAASFSKDEPPIFRYWDAENRSQIHVLDAKGCPHEGITSYATVGLSQHPLMRNGEEFNTRVEFLGACRDSFPAYGEVLATLSFCVINSKWFCAPGMIFPGAVAMHGLSSTMSDIYFSYPFLWGDSFKSSVFEGVTTSWLQAVPISRKEADYAEKYGADKLEALLIERDIDVFDLNRKSVA